MTKYPLSSNMPPERIHSKTGKSLRDITIENIMEGNISSEDIKISKDVLLLQGEVAAQAGREKLKDNFTRASELIEIPDKELLHIYDKLRPNRATKEELLELAHRLTRVYGANSCAKLVLDAASVYEKRGILK